MKTKLAGRHLSLQSRITETIASVEKMASAASSNEKVKDLLKYEKKEHGHVPSVQEEKDEKKGSEKTSSIDFSDPSQIEKLASALNFVGDELIKEAAYNGGESHQGGMQLETNSQVSGSQPYKKDSSKGHNVPMSTGLEKAPDAAGKNTVPTNMGAAPGGKGGSMLNVLKTAGEKCTCSGAKTCAYCKAMPEKKSSVQRMEAAVAKLASGGKEQPKAPEGKTAPAAPAKPEEKEDEEKTASLDFILGKIAESTQGGMTLDSKSGDGPKPPTGSAGGNDARKHLESNEAAVNMKKVDGKKPQKRMLSEVLNEPALSAAHDSKVQENLRNATKGGVKIAAAKALIQKIAEDPNHPQHELLKTAMKNSKKGKIEKEGNSNAGYGGLPPVASAGGM